MNLDKTNRQKGKSLSEDIRMISTRLLTHEFYKNSELKARRTVTGF